jgi:hypothetical protein
VIVRYAHGQFDILRYCCDSNTASSYLGHGNAEPEGWRAATTIEKYGVNIRATDRWRDSRIRLLVLRSPCLILLP